MSKSGGKGPMRQWAESSYSSTTGRAARSSVSAQSSHSAQGVVRPWTTSAQISEATGRAEGGAPNISGMNRSGSADRGRQKYSREDRGSNSGGRSDDEHPSRRER